MTNTQHAKTIKQIANLNYESWISTEITNDRSIHRDRLRL